MSSAPRSPSDRAGSDDPILAAVLQLIADDGVKVPPVPAVVARLNEKLSNPSCEMREVTQLVGTDQALSAHIVRCASSTLLAARSPVHSLNEAVMRVGTNGLFSLAVTFSLGREVSRRSPLQSLRRDIFRRAAANAEFGRRLAGRRSVDPEGAFLVGLLGNFGLTVALGAIEQVLATTSAKESRPADAWMEIARQAEKRFGAEVASRWGMPKVVTDVMKARQTREGEPRLLAFVQLLDTAEKLTELFCSEASPSEADIAAAIGCSETEAVEIAGFLPSVAGAVLVLGAATEDVKVTQPVPTPAAAVAQPPTSSLKGPVIPTSIPVTVERKGGDHQIVCVGLAVDGFLATGTQPLPHNQVVKCKMLGVDEDLELVAFVAAVVHDGDYRFEMKPMGLVGAHARRWQKLRSDASPESNPDVRVASPTGPDWPSQTAQPPAQPGNTPGGVSLHADKGSAIRRIGGWLRGRGES